MKKSTASSAMSPGKNKYIAFLNPIASPTCSTKMPRVPEIARIMKSKFRNQLISHHPQWRSSRRERMLCRRPGCWPGQSQRWLWRGSQTRSPQTGNTGLGIIIIMESVADNTCRMRHLKIQLLQKTGCYCQSLDIPKAMKQYGGSR